MLPSMDLIDLVINSSFIKTKVLYFFHIVIIYVFFFNFMALFT